MNELLETIATQAAADLYQLIRDGNDDILNAIHKMQAEAQLQETNPKFALGFKITVDLDKRTYDCDLSWSLKQTLGTSHKLDDPNQPTLPMAGGVEIHTADGKKIFDSAKSAAEFITSDAKKILKNTAKGRNN